MVHTYLSNMKHCSLTVQAFAINILTKLTELVVLSTNAVGLVSHNLTHLDMRGYIVAHVKLSC